MKSNVVRPVYVSSTCLCQLDMQNTNTTSLLSTALTLLYSANYLNLKETFFLNDCQRLQERLKSCRPSSACSPSQPLPLPLPLLLGGCRAAFLSAASVSARWSLARVRCSPCSCSTRRVAAMSLASSRGTTARPSASRAVSPAMLFFILSGRCSRCRARSRSSYKCVIQSFSDGMMKTQCNATMTAVLPRAAPPAR